MAIQATRTQLRRSDWTDAANDVIARHGLDAVSIEALAAGLGVTKGSFYWHFRTRAALIGAALAEWAIHRTRTLISQLNGITDPADRLRELVAGGGATVDPMDVQLLASMRDPVVAAALRDHHRLWLDFAELAYRQMGSTDDEARARATLAYSAYLGMVVLHASDASDSSPTQDRVLREVMLEVLLPQTETSNTRPPK